MADILLEVCVDDAAGLLAAHAGGADRIELCSALSAGGLTPTPGLMALAATLDIPVYAMIRPRAGDFVYSALDIDGMKRDIDSIRTAGLAGVVLGANRSDGRLDDHAMGELLRHLAGMPATLHRAFDLVPDIAEAVETAVDLGFERILTSGRARSAIEGIDDIVLTHRAASGRLTVMPGSGVTIDTADRILSAAGFTEIHSSCSQTLPTADRKLVTLGFADPLSRRTGEAVVRALQDHMKTRG